ncbi:MAG TPA: SGNH/GDSL hydrolase family protein [Candidatus Acidoferrales bacterium]|nr:SGNH/GDSL hydrolase family protein [Candidatus Acidoferrales bacterium]
MTKIDRLASRLLLLILTIALVPGFVSAAPQQTNEHWVATWMASPMEGTWSDGFQNQTVRMIAHVSLGGSRVRVEFSNAFGKQSLTIGAAHVGIQAKDAAIVPGSDRALKFNGSPSVTIPPGALEISDPVDLTVSPLSNLAVSVYVPEQTEPATYHASGLHTTYISAAGNFAADQDMTSQWTTASYYWLSGVDVESGAESAAIVALGDSITDGAHSSLNGNMQWPSQLADRLQKDPATAHLAVANAGIGGNRILHDVSGPNALARLDRDVIARAGVKYVIVLESINDLGWPHEAAAHGTQEVTADQLIAGLRQIIDRAHAHGIKVFGATLTPYGGANYSSQEGEEKREAINQWIRTGGAFDGVIDFDAAVRDPNNPKQFLPANDSGDHLHPNDTGYKAMATSINLSLFR